MKTKTKREAGKKPATITTDTPRTPNANGYSLEAVPASGDGKSRYRLPVNCEGNRLPGQAAVIAASYRDLALAHIAGTPEIREVKTVPLWYFGISNETGEVVKLPRGSFKGVMELVVSRSGRFSNPTETGGALLDRALLEPGFEVRDETIWEALEQVIADERPSPEVARTICDAVAALILCRAGLRINGFHELPPIGKEHR
jgi:hypothetical protein